VPRKFRNIVFVVFVIFAIFAIFAFYLPFLHFSLDDGTFLNSRKMKIEGLPFMFSSAFLQSKCS